MNASGGVLVYGVRPNGVIYGEDMINRKEKDMLFHGAIDEALKRIIPNVGLEAYKPLFHEVVCDGPEEKRTVLEIKVDGKSRRAEVYEDIRHNVCMCV